MELTQTDIKSMEAVGSSESGAQIYHIVTKGGRHYMAKKMPSGMFSILSEGPHRAIARHTAGSIEKNIQWNEGLFKSEDMSLTKDEPIQDRPELTSTPDKHYKLAKWHSQAASKFAPLPAGHPDQSPDLTERHNRNMAHLMHTDIALAHYKAAGNTNAEIEHANNMKLGHHGIEGTKPPFDAYELQLAYNKKYAPLGKWFPSGLGYDYTK